MAMNGVINLHFLTILMNTLEETVEFGKKLGILPKSVKCPNCKTLLQKPYFLNRSKSDCREIRYQCNKKQYRGRGKKIQFHSKQEHGLGSHILH